MTYTKKDKRLRKKAYKNLQKQSIPSRGFVKFSYYGSKVLYLLALVIGIYSAYETSKTDPFWFEYLVPAVYAGAIFALGLMLAAVYKGFTRGLMVRLYELPLSATDEKVTVDGDTVIYSYVDRGLSDGGEVSRFVLNKSDLEKVEYNEGTRMLTLHGNIKEERYKGDSLVKIYDLAKLSIWNIYKDLDLYEKLCK